MQINHQKPSHRKHHRLSTPLGIRINDVSYPSIDWCIGGFSIGDWNDKEKKVGEKVACYFKLPFQGFDIGFETEATILRIDTKKAIMAATFSNLSDRQHNILQHFAEELVRGSMTHVNDTIARIDTPITPVSAESNASPTSDMPLRRWNIRNIVTVSTYFAMGIFLVLYIGFTIYTNYFTLEVSSGVVSSKVEHIYSSTNGQIINISDATDNLVEAGTALLRIDNPMLQERIDLAKLRIHRKEILLLSKQQTFEVETQKMADYANFAKMSLDQSKENASSSRVLVNLANSEVKRLKHLRGMKMSSQQELDKAMSQLTLAYNQLKQALVEEHQKKETVNLVERGYFFTGEKLIGNLNELKVEITRLNQEVHLAKNELDILYEQKNRMTINSPGLGRVIKLFKQLGSNVEAGELIGLFEHNVRRAVDVYLTQEEVLGVKFGSQAKIYFPSIDKTVTASVIAIDRTGSTGTNKQTDYSWIQNDRTVKTTLEIEGMEDNEIRELLPHGLPAIVAFNDLKSGIVGRFIRSILLHTAST